MLIKAAVGVAAAALALAGCQAGTSPTHGEAATARPTPVVATAPASVAPVTTTRTATGTARLLTCSDFATQAAAEAYLKATPAARSRLDTNGDGIACGARFAPKPTLSSPTRSATNTHRKASGTTDTSRSSSSSTKPLCPVDRGPVAGDWCQHSANGPDDPGFVAQCPVPGLPKVDWPAAVDGKCS